MKIMFICLGNICRSPMAEFMFKKMLNDNGKSDKVFVSSGAVSHEEEGNPIHYGAKKVLREHNIPFSERYAKVITENDYKNFDYFIGMDERNRQKMNKIFNGDKENKVYILSDFGGISGDVSDPYWTGDFDTTFCDIKNGLCSLYKKIVKD